MTGPLPWGVPLPCFSREIEGVRSLLWLPVAPACNMRCFSCAGRIDRVADSVFPGIALSPDDALARVNALVDRGEAPAGLLVWGPGEPLANASTYVALRKLRWVYPDMPVTVCTNGILLSERLGELVRTGVGRLIVSINAVTAPTAELIYGSVNYRARRYTGAAAAELILQQQWNGLENAVEAGLAVTVYAANIAGVNDHEVPEIERRSKAVGAEQVAVVVVAP